MESNQNFVLSYVSISLMTLQMFAECKSLFKKKKSFNLQTLPPQYSVKFSGYDLTLPLFSQSTYRYSKPRENTVLLQVSK